MPDPTPIREPIVVGDLSDLSPEELDEELGLNGIVHDLVVVAYDMVPDPATRARERHEYTFHIVCDLRSEKIIATLNRMAKTRNPTTGEMETDDNAVAISNARMICNVVVPHERNAFLDVLEDPNLAFGKKFWGQLSQKVVDTFVEEADRPLELRAGSSSGKGKRSTTRTVAHNGRVSTSRPALSR